MFNDLTDWRRKSSDTSVGWLFTVIVGSVLRWSDSFPDERCEGCCSLNDSSGKESSGMSECKSAFSWSFIESYDRMILPWLFFSDSSASETASALGSNIALVDSTTACTAGS